MATIFECDFNDTDFPQGGSHPAGVAWDAGIDGDSPNASGLPPQVGKLQSGANLAISLGGEYSKITSAASRRAGYKGFRFYIEGQNNYTGGFAPEADTNNHNEIWFRWYMRTAATWDLGRPQYWKLWRDDSAEIIFGNGYGDGASVAGAWGLVITNPDDATNYGDDAHIGGDALWNGSPAIPGDSDWHCYEFHIKVSSASPGNDGVFEFWFDGDQKTSASDVSFDSTTQFGAFYLNNQNLVANGPVAVDVTDMKMVNSGGPIGLISGGSVGRIVGPGGSAMSYFR